MAEFVQGNAGEDGDDEGDAVERGVGAASQILGDPDPGEQNQERKVDADLAAGDTRDRNRPGHDARLDVTSAGIGRWFKPTL
jgi:hypothetical protein